MKKNFFGRAIKKVRRVFKNLYFLFFLNGLMIASVIYSYQEDQYERDLFGFLSSEVLYQVGADKNAPDDSIIIKSMHFTYELQSTRNQYFSHSRLNSFKASNLQPLTFHLMTAQGSCGSYSLVLARILQELNYEVRFPQMKVNGNYGGHISIEVKADDGWIVLDPFYNHYFIKPGGGLASFADVQANWDHYKKQVPQGYNMDYNYQGVRYTNWNKIPVLMPALKKVLDITIGKEKADKLSLRNIVLRKFYFIFIVLLSLYIPLTIYSLFLFFKTPRGRQLLKRELHVQNAVMPREAIR
ncbi:MAG: transglutaminase domain-containing protein [Chitinophagaceae bacterium]|nr:transglutaminase domain-containing protein [Chitinophagaceae bacterium]